MIQPLPRTLEAWCWRYPDSATKGRTWHYFGLHFTAKPDSCRFLLEVIGELRSGEISHRSIPLKPLQKPDEARISGGNRYEAFRSLRLSLCPASEHLKQMSFRSEGDRALFDFTVTELRQLERGIRDVQAGTGDYCISPDTDRKRLCGEQDRRSESLWFWPCFGHLWVVP